MIGDYINKIYIALLVVSILMLGFAAYKIISYKNETLDFEKKLFLSKESDNDILSRGYFMQFSNIYIEETAQNYIFKDTANRKMFEILKSEVNSFSPDLEKPSSLCKSVRVTESLNTGKTYDIVNDDCI